jgi:hypothetical protein
MDLTDPQTKADAVAALVAFRELLDAYDATYDPTDIALYVDDDGTEEREAKRADLRQQILRRIRGVRLVLQATSSHRLLFSARFKNLDPLANLFTEIEDASMSRAVLDSIEEALGVLDTPARLLQLATPPTPDPLERVLRICRQFAIAARPLQRRRANHNPYRLDDEYDVQDLMQAFLRIDFDDIRPEEWTPSYAGGSSKMDFLLKDEQIVVETKKSRETLTAAAIGEELLADIARYEKHLDCKTLVCFVFDPDHRIANPAGLARDLTKQHGTLTVICIVAPV